MKYIKITSPRSSHLDSIFEVRQIDKDGAITKHEDLYFKTHEYEEVVVTSKTDFLKLEEDLNVLRKEKEQLGGKKSDGCLSATIITVLLGLLIWSFVK